MGFAQYTDIRKKRCARCAREYLPPGAGNGMCSDRCWMASRSRRGTQGDQLTRAWEGLAERAERRVTGNAQVNGWLREAAERNALERYQRERTETMGLISRLRAKSDPYARYASRGSAQRSAKCTGPGCEVCAEGRRLDAKRAAAPGAYERGSVITTGYREVYR
jgi:hypothetical protein